MTKEEWSKVEKALQSLYTQVVLNIDGYKINLHLERMNTFKNVITVYVNGEFKGKWLLEECEERRRFFRKREKSLISAKDRKALNKLPKKERKEFEEDYGGKYSWYEPWWTSFSSLKRHLIKENESIELVEIR